MEKQVVTVEGMSCAHCKNAVEKAVRSLAGVASAEVNLEAKTLTVEFEAAKINLAAIKTAVAEEGFTTP